MKEIEEYIKQLGREHEVLPNSEPDAPLGELEEYKFLKAVLIPMKDPLWWQAVRNISAELFDGDVVVVHDPYFVEQTLLNEAVNVVGALAIYYTNLMDASFQLMEEGDNYYYVNDYEKIDINSLSKLVSNCFVNHLDSVETNIKNQLLQIAQKPEWAEILYKEKSKDPEKIDIEGITRQINRLFL